MEWIGGFGNENGKCEVVNSFDHVMLCLLSNSIFSHWQRCHPMLCVDIMVLPNTTDSSRLKFCGSYRFTSKTLRCNIWCQLVVNELRQIGISINQIQYIHCYRIIGAQYPPSFLVTNLHRGT